MSQNSKTQNNPFSGLVDFVGDMNRMADRMHNLGSRGQAQARSHSDAWTPVVDISAVDEQLLIEAELAGVAEEDIEVTYTGTTLAIAGQRRLQQDRSDQAVYHTRERSWGRFRRSIDLPEGVYRDDITVTFNGGLLRIAVNNYARTQADGPAPLPVNEASSRG